MPTTIRKQIIDLIETTLKGIVDSNGYQTNIGLHVFRSRTSDLQDHEYPGCVLWDGEDKKVEHTANKHMHEVQFEIEMWCKDSNGDMVNETLDEMIADVDRAIGSNRRWGGIAWRSTVTL